MAETRRQYAARYLRDKLFNIVQFYDKEALSNPQEVQDIMFDIIETLIPEEEIEIVKNGGQLRAK